MAPSPAALAAAATEATREQDRLWLRPNRAPEYAGMGIARLYKWRRQGLLPHCRPAHQDVLVYHRPGLDRMIAARAGGKTIACRSGTTLADPALAEKLLLPHPKRGS